MRGSSLLWRPRSARLTVSQEWPRARQIGSGVKGVAFVWNDAPTAALLCCPGHGRWCCLSSLAGFCVALVAW